MELENRVAPGRCVPATFGRACRYYYQEGRSRTRRRVSRQLHLRTTERQKQEVEDLEDYVVVRPRRCRTQARSRRTRTGSSRLWLQCFGTQSRSIGHSAVLVLCIIRASASRRGPFRVRRGHGHPVSAKQQRRAANCRTSATAIEIPDTSVLWGYMA